MHQILSRKKSLAARAFELQTQQRCQHLLFSYTDQPQHPSQPATKCKSSESAQALHAIIWESMCRGHMDCMLVIAHVSARS